MRRFLDIFFGFLLIFIFFVSPIFASDSIELTGDILKIVLPAAGYGMTFYYNDYQGRAEFYKSFLTTLGITYTLKYSVHKTRPNGEPGSFPSGHASVAFSGASFIQKRYGWKFGIPAYIAATFVAWSRIESKNHYLEDVIAGGFIGITVTYVFTDKY